MRLLSLTLCAMLGIVALSGIPGHALQPESHRPAPEGRAATRSTTTEATLCLHQQIPWGPGQAVGATDGSVVAGIGSVARIVDVADPVRPLVVSDLVLPAAVSEVAFVDRYALLADLGGRLHVVDVLDPREPTVVAEIELPGSCRRMAVSGTTAIAALGRQGLAVVDLRDPAAPELLAELQLADVVNDVVVRGSRAYVATTAYLQGSTMGSLTILDISDPSTPIEIGSATTEDAASAVEVKGPHAFVARWQAGLTVLDISDEKQPRPVGSLDRFIRGTDLAVRADGLWVTEGNQGLIQVDISDPLAPSVAATVELGDWSYEVAIARDHAFVAAGTRGLRVIDLDAATGPIEVSSLEGQPWVRDVAIADDLLYVRTDGLLRLYRVLAIEDPVEVGRLDLSVFTPGVALTAAEDRLYLVAGSAHGEFPISLHIVDTSDPGHPRLLGRFEGLPPETIQLNPIVVDDHVVVAGNFLRDGGTSYDTRLWVIGVAAPAAPTEVAFAELGGYTHDLAASGDLVYLATSLNPDPDGIRVIDLSEPDQPTIVGHFAAQGWTPRDIEVCGSTAVGIDVDSLHVMALDDPLAPVEVGSLGSFTDTALYGLSWDRHSVLVGDFRGVHLVDLRERSMPTPYGYLELPASYESFRMRDGAVFVAAGGSGVQIFERCRTIASRRSGHRVDP